MKTCPKCGNIIENDNAKFCRKCGAKQPEIVVEKQESIAINTSPKDGILLSDLPKRQLPDDGGQTLSANFTNKKPISSSFASPIVATEEKGLLWAVKTCFRKYYCLVKGIIDNDEGEINAPIGRSSNDRQKMCVTDKNSKEAITEFKVLDRFVDSCLLDVELKTGRTHQIRVHMAYINHPIVNDNVYGYKKLDDLEFGQMLHAKTIGFVHPKNGKYLEFSVDMPTKFYEILKKYEEE